jgi:hypothetical protein
VAQPPGNSRPGGTPSTSDHEEHDMTTTDLRITDFERAPWLPVLELAKTRGFYGEMCADYLLRYDVIGDTYYLDVAREYARDVKAMRAEDSRIGDAYRAAWRESQAVVA